MKRKTIKRHIADFLVAFINSFAKAFGNRFYAFYLDYVCREFNYFGHMVMVTINDRIVELYCPNRLTKWRADTFFSKEPDTLAWISHFPVGSVLWDIGANVGTYSIYAAVTRDAHVLAFEPIPENYAVLCENIGKNRLADKISAFPIAVNNETKIGRLSMSTADAGSAFASFSGEGIFDQSVISLLGYSIDDFIDAFSPPLPEYIKIDVDGNEALILSGARRTLADSRLRSILVEDEESESSQLEIIKKIMEEFSFQLVGSYRSPLFPNSNTLNYRFDRL